MSLSRLCPEGSIRLINLPSDHDGEKLINTVAGNNSNTIVVIQ